MPDNQNIFHPSLLLALGFMMSASYVFAQIPIYGQSYALVIGIDKYPADNWKDLNYAKKDAEDFAAFLRNQGFDVTTLFNEQATKTAIVSEMEERLANTLKPNDRVIIFFAGHGYTRKSGGKAWGYVVPYLYLEGKNMGVADYIPFDELQRQSRTMGTAKHQLFLLDCCFGGLLGRRSGGVKPGIPNYIAAVTSRRARQFITAGGEDQTVQDFGPGQNSLFTQSLLEALRDGNADLDSDGFITFNELSSFLITRASNSYQTPTAGTLAEHGLGEFVFLSPQGASQQTTASSQPRGLPWQTRSSLAEDDIKMMVLYRGYYHSEWNPAGGDSIPPFLTLENLDDDFVVRDSRTNLMWQQEGKSYLNFEEAAKYVDRLNIDRFAGYDGWRLPSLEEALSLVEAEKLDGYHIQQVFKRTQWWFWTSDRANDGTKRWVVNYFYGNCAPAFEHGSNVVRAVRSIP